MTSKDFADHMACVREKTAEMLARIDENGVLTLVMDDIRKGVTFEEAQAHDIRGSVIPIHDAARIILSHEGKVKFLKDRRPPIPQGGECETCGGDQYLQPCPTCGEE